MTILLSICIPTFNRKKLLNETLSHLLPQITDEVEVIICDNDSQDGTDSLIKEKKDRIVYYKQQKNVGMDDNFIKAVTLASGKYVWIHSDDDIPAPNAVSEILKVLRNNNTVGFLSLQATGCDKNMNNYSDCIINTRWMPVDKNELLKKVGEMITFASIIVAKKSIIIMEYLNYFRGTMLIPAALALQTAGCSDNILISQTTLVYARGGNNGGYDALTVFSKNLSILLKNSSRYGYSKKSLDSVYQDVLNNVMLYIVKVWPINPVGIINLTRYSYMHKSFYSKVIPALIKRLLKNK